MGMAFGRYTMTDDELLDLYPDFTLDEIKRGLAVPAVEMSAWDRRLYEHERSIYGDALSIGATEYVSAEAPIEPLWKSLIGLICAFIIIMGLGAVLYGVFG